MVSLFLVEDEMLSRESIKKNVPWTENGIDFLGDAPDGEMALPQILEKKPDIVLTDIKMPFMDGLELSQLIRDKLPETRIIILSGYNEFDYARQAISLGISEYLLKPVAVEDILAAVEKVRGNIERTRQAQQEKSAQEQARREIFFSSLYSGFLSGTGEILNRAESLSLPIAASLYRVVVADFDPPFDGEGEKWKTLLYQTPDALASGFNGRQVAYLLCVENEQVLAARENRLKNWLEEFCARYEMRVNLLKGDTVRRLSDLDKSYQTANLRRGGQPEFGAKQESDRRKASGKRGTVGISAKRKSGQRTPVLGILSHGNGRCSALVYLSVLSDDRAVFCNSEIRGRNRHDDSAGPDGQRSAGTLDCYRLHRG